MQAQKQVPAIFFCDVIMSATSAWSSFALHVLHWRYPKSERNKTRLTLAPNRGSLGVLWTYSGSVVVLSWDSTHKNTQISTLAHAYVTPHWPYLARHKHARFASSAYKTYAFAQRHKSDKNRPVNLAKEKLLLLPWHFCINFNIFCLNQQATMSLIWLTKLEKSITWPVKAARTARAKWWGGSGWPYSHRRQIQWKNCYRYTRRKVVNSKEDSALASTCR